MTAKAFTLLLLSIIAISGCGDDQEEADTPLGQDSVPFTPSEDVLDAEVSEPASVLWAPPSLRFNRNNLQLQSLALYNPGTSGSIYLFSANFSGPGWGVYGTDCPTVLLPQRSCAILTGPNGGASTNVLFEVTYQSDESSETMETVTTDLGFD